MKILVKIKSVYGNELVYPACDTSKKFASLTNSKTLTRNTLSIIKSLGYSIELVNGYGL
jgi:hypothetical protein